MSKYKTQIKKLHSQGYTHAQIVRKIGCAKSMVTYHLDDTQRLKLLKRQYNRRKKSHPYMSKMESFKHRKSHTPSDINYNLQDVIDKLGEQPICYLTGESINIYQVRSYQFDHVLPTSRGGDNSLNNLNICTTIANQAKGKMTVDEFYLLCKQIVNNLQLADEESNLYHYTPS